MVRTVMIAAIAASIMVLVSAQELALPDALGKTAEYVGRYRTKASGISLEEQLLLTEMGTTQRVPRRVASDLVLINGSERLMGLRDPFAIDTRAVRDRQPRIIKALVEPTQATWKQAQDFTREGAYLLLHNVVLWYSDPMLALRFIESDNQSRMTYKLEGRKRVNSVQVQAIGFSEKKADRRIYLLDTPDNPASSGRIWIEPSTGAVHQTELWLQSDTVVARIQVTYALDAKIDVLVPREATYSLQSLERGTGITNMGVGGVNRQITFEAIAKYSSAQYTPIDLSKIVR